MPSNKELWTLPLPPNLAPLQCARALSAASAVALAAALRVAWPAGPRLPPTLALLCGSWRAARPGRRAGGEPGAREGRPGAAAAPFPEQTPLPGTGCAGSRRVPLMLPPLLGGRTIVAPLGLPQGPRNELSRLCLIVAGASRNGGVGGGELPHSRLDLGRV